MIQLATYASGLLFGAGLMLSGLVNPVKVQNFLDVAGTWDPSLAFTMAAAVVVTAVGYRGLFARKAPLLSPAYHVPEPGVVDARLMAGAALFGLGWGMVGYCPGPAVAALAGGSAPVLTFVAAMLAGMAAARSLPASRARVTPQSQS